MTGLSDGPEVIETLLMVAGTVDDDRPLGRLIGSVPRLSDRPVEGITVGGGISVETAGTEEDTWLALLGAAELLGSAATEDCREAFPVVDFPLGFAIGLKIGPPFSAKKVCLKKTE